MKNKSELLSLYESLKVSRDPKQRGRDFEQLLLALLDQEKLAPELGPPHRGEQIDISFACHGRFFLLEAKWHRAERPVQAHHIFSFRGKLEGRLVGTTGVFISMSDYTRNAVSAVTFGRTINTVLFDSKDIELALGEEYSFSDILLCKLRRASAYGDPYYSYQTYLDLLGGSK